MELPEYIARKAKEYHNAMKIANKAYEDVTLWFNKNTDADGVYV